MKLIHEEWRTHMTVATDSSGAISFRGFYGHYKLTVGGRAAEFDIATGAPADFSVALQ
jgi:hypothetical protein